MQTILFTTDEEILSSIGLHDNCFQEEMACHHGNSTDKSEENRPCTGNGEGEGKKEGENKNGSFTALTEPCPLQPLCGQGESAFPSCLPLCGGCHVLLQWCRCG